MLSTSAVSLDAIGATQTITASVKDQRGDAIPAIAVTWTSSEPAAAVATAAGASAQSAVITSQANGSATIIATAGAATASVGVMVVQVAATVQKTAGDAQSGTVNVPLATLLTVRVQHRLGVAIAAQAVTFAVVQGGGSLSSTSATTCSDGTASTAWTLGKASAQLQQVTASAGPPRSLNFGSIVDLLTACPSCI